MLSLCTCNIEDIYHYNICFIRNPIYIFYISMFRTSSSHLRTVSSHLRTVSSATRRSEIWSEWRLTVITATVRIALVDILDLSEVDIPAGGFLYPAVGWG